MCIWIQKRVTLYFHTGGWWPVREFSRCSSFAIWLGISSPIFQKRLGFLLKSGEKRKRDLSDTWQKLLCDQTMSRKKGLSAIPFQLPESKYHNHVCITQYAEEVRTRAPFADRFFRAPAPPPPITVFAHPRPLRRSLFLRTRDPSADRCFRAPAHPRTRAPSADRCLRAIAPPPPIAVFAHPRPLRWSLFSRTRVPSAERCFRNFSKDKKMQSFLVQPATLPADFKGEKWIDDCRLSPRNERIRVGFCRRGSPVNQR